MHEELSRKQMWALITIHKHFVSNHLLESKGSFGVMHSSRLKRTLVSVNDAYKAAEVIKEMRNTRHPFMGLIKHVD